MISQARDKLGPKDNIEFEDDPRLLPAIHGIWPALLDLLNDMSSQAMASVAFRAAVRVLRTLTDCASSFIRERFRSSVWPTMRQNLMLLASWASADSGSHDSSSLNSKAGGMADRGISELRQARNEEAMEIALKQARASGAPILPQSVTLRARGTNVAAQTRLQPRVAQSLLVEIFQFLVCKRV